MSVAHASHVFGRRSFQPGSQTPLAANSAAFSKSPGWLVACAAVLIFIHFGRPFDNFLVGLKIPAVICSIGILAAFACGAFRFLLSRPGKAFVAFLVWMAVCAPFSFWRGGSAQYVLYFLQFWVILFVIIAAACRNPKTVAALGAVLAAACIFNILIGGGEQYGRFGSTGTFGNPDDVALLAGFAIPFVVLAANRFRNVVVRYGIMALCTGYLLFAIGKTATRAAILGLLGMFWVYLRRSKVSSRALLVGFAVAATVAGIFALPREAVQRLLTITSALDSSALEQADHLTEADASTLERKQLLQDAIRAAITHPVFGVGPGEFVDFTYRTRNPTGPHRVFLQSHNTYAQVASEEGLIGLIFFVIFLVSIYRTIRSVRKINSSEPSDDQQLISQILLCLEAALVYFVICATFMTCDKHPHQFALAGFAIALERMFKQASPQPAVPVSLRQPRRRQAKAPRTPLRAAPAGPRPR